MDGQAWLDEIIGHYRSYKRQCERAVAQVSDEQLFSPLGDNPNSIAVILQHVGANHRSRWRNFLSSDGEKRDRQREAEFSVESETSDSIRETWEEGWAIALDSLSSLTPADLDLTITIRGEPHSVVQAVHRNLNHVVFHSGQIIQLAKHFAAADWQPLSIPPGETDAFNAKMRAKYGDWWAGESSLDAKR